MGQNLQFTLQSFEELVLARLREFLIEGFKFTPFTHEFSKMFSFYSHLKALREIPIQTNASTMIAMMGINT